MTERESENPLLERVTRLEVDMDWIKKTLEKIDRRTWYTLGSVVVFGVISIVLSML